MIKYNLIQETVHSCSQSNCEIGQDFARMRSNYCTLSLTATFNNCTLIYKIRTNICFPLASISSGIVPISVHPPPSQGDGRVAQMSLSLS